jgi:putative tryptophan/tyrosine transport system substrate-binding protein
VKRREFITLLGAAAAWPRAVHAQLPDQTRRVGLLVGLPQGKPETNARIAAFRGGLESLGWSEGGNIRIDYRYAPGANPDQAKVFAKELVALQPAVIVAQTPPVAAVMKQETQTIPIVFMSVGDPIGMGLIGSLGRPGGNLTGLMTFEASVAGKWLAMLKEIEPRLRRAAFVGNPTTTTYDYYLRSAEGAASSLGIELMPSVVENTADIERLMDSFHRMTGTGLVVLPDPTTLLHLNLIVELAARHSVPAVYDRREYVVAGGLMSYGIDRVDEFRRAASYVDRILRGAKPADLPVQEPTKFETVLNLKAAKALDLTVPPGLLVAADEVIE